MEREEHEAFEPKIFLESVEIDPDEVAEDGRKFGEALRKGPEATKDALDQFPKKFIGCGDSGKKLDRLPVVSGIKKAVADSIGGTYRYIETERNDSTFYCMVIKK